MKKLALFLMGLILSCEVLAQQVDYGGIWRASIDPGNFVIVTQRGQSMVIAALDSDGMWDAYTGAIDGSSAKVTTIIGRVQIEMTLRFLSSTQALARLDSCKPINPNYVCAFPVGAEIIYSKVF